MAYKIRSDYVHAEPHSEAASHLGASACASMFPVLKNDNII